jgi:hypothetical protein
MEIDSLLRTKRAGIHEARITCQQLTCFEERVSPLLLQDESRASAERYAQYLLKDNQGYFDWLCKGDEYKKVASHIQLAPHKKFAKSSEAYVRDLFDINSALQYASDYCKNSSNKVVRELTDNFRLLHERYIDFSNRVLRTTNIQYGDLKKALTKFFDFKNWSQFKLKFPGVLPS